MKACEIFKADCWILADIANQSPVWDRLTSAFNLYRWWHLVRVASPKQEQRVMTVLAWTGKQTRVVDCVPCEIGVNDSCWHVLTSHSDVTLAHVLLVSLGACSQKVQLFELWSTSCRRPSHLSTLRTKPDLQFDQDMVNIIHIYALIFHLRASFVTTYALPYFREDILLERFLKSEPVSTLFGIRTWSAAPLWEGQKSVSRGRSRSNRSIRSSRSKWSK